MRSPTPVKETFRTTRTDIGVLLSRWPAAVVGVTVDGVPLRGGEYEVADGIVYRRSAGRRVPWRGSQVVVSHRA